MISRFQVIRFLSALMLLESASATLHRRSMNESSLSTNVTSNATNVPKAGNEPSRDALFYVQIFGCIIIMITGTVGNLLVLIIFLSRWSMLKTCEVFMISLAFADLVGTFTIPLEMLRDVLDLYDPGNGHFLGCQLSSWLGTTCISVSALTLVTIAVDRFIVVAWPLKMRQGFSPIIIFTIVITWVIGGSMAFPYFIYVKQNYHEYHGYYCQNVLEKKEVKKYYLTLFFLQVLLPIWAMTFLYSFIVYKLRSGSVSARRLSETDNVVRIRSRRQRRATKLFIVVVIVFAALVLPASIFSLLATFGKVEPTATNRKIYVILSLLLAANSCINPIIYSRLHKSFRKSTVAFLFGCCCKEYYRYEWESKFISRSSYYQRRRYTDQSYTRNTVASMRRKSASPCPEDLAAQCASNGTPPRSVSGISSRSSRISSSGSDDVFSRISSIRSAHRNEDSSKIHLQKIPEQNGPYVPLDRQCSDDVTPVPRPFGPLDRQCSDDINLDPRPGKYMQFLNHTLEEEHLNNEAFFSNEASADIKLQALPEPEQEATGAALSEGKLPGMLNKAGYNSLKSNGHFPRLNGVNDTKF